MHALDQPKDNAVRQALTRNSRAAQPAAPAVAQSHMEHAAPQQPNPPDVTLRTRQVVKRRPIVQLRQLLDANVLQAGSGVLCIDYKQQSAQADLLRDGRIQQDEQIFATPSAFSLAFKRTLNPGLLSDDGWKSVRYGEKQLEEFKQQFTDQWDTATPERGGAAPLAEAALAAHQTADMVMDTHTAAEHTHRRSTGGQPVMSLKNVGPVRAAPDAIHGLLRSKRHRSAALSKTAQHEQSADAADKQRCAALVSQPVVPARQRGLQPIRLPPPPSQSAAGRALQVPAAAPAVLPPAFSLTEELPAGAKPGAPQPARATLRLPLIALQHFRLPAADQPQTRGKPTSASVSEHRSAQSKSKLAAKPKAASPPRPPPQPSGPPSAGVPKLPKVPTQVRAVDACLPKAPKPVPSSMSVNPGRQERRNVKAPTRFDGVSEMGHSMMQLEAYAHKAGTPGGGDVQPFAIVVHPRVLAAIDVHAHLCMDEVIGIFGGTYDAAIQRMNISAAIAVKEGQHGEGKIDVEMDAADQSRAVRTHHLGASSMVLR